MLKTLISRKSWAVVFLFLLMLNAPSAVNAQPDCNCEQYLPDMDAVDACEANCMGVDIPVNHNVWVLLAGGIVLAVVKRRQLMGLYA